jgi:hypothetical protein
VNTYRWQKLDINIIQNPPCWLLPDDVCYYAREFTKRGGYQASETNQLIYNLKKSINRRQHPDWYYKQQAIEKFAKELSLMLTRQHVVMCIPTSKPKNHPLYDSRLDDVLSKLVQYNPKIQVVDPIVRTDAVVAKHEGGPRKPSIELKSLQWKGLILTNIPSLIILIDDIITSGSSFKACQNLILENVPTTRVIGVFWARAIDKVL